ncbi:histidine kinase [Streptomyces pluripotens]|uniref:Histidine kinase n=1 Tax=Streptomyces pluripotens TaxID=1355015 RepID=A0A221P7I8_9ACTN|nr:MULTISPECIES: GAF domain-containing sensor histidine kinase [Streptomyces]ARP73855.1 histidine kinase [Streptomyces pluripotens]ASN28112.1 histidine kinase [Streptomyces pluripotens]KIE23366.1 histidine kinase [Streptomyces sp. MUSC 125]MCH0558276.1 GAF domain-containing sensor histidine kinase [Streptomyces sp. MUM 16J]
MAIPEEPRVRLPQLRLDELLEELQARLDAARGTRDRVHSLLEAVLSVGRELDLEHALHSIVEAAAALVDAEYAALGVIGPDGSTLTAFHTVGATDQDIAAIGHFPEGHGILGELIRHPAPLRLSKLSQHPSSYGFPPNHPPMNSFLGVPIRVRGQVFGNLYLTEKRGGLDFDEEDEAVLSTLAVAAGVAIDNARLYEESLLRERWLLANAEISHSLMSGSERAEALDLIAERAREITGSALAAVAMPMADAPALGVEIAVGAEADAHRGLVLPLGESLMGLAFSAAAPVSSDDVNSDARVAPEPPRFRGLGPAVAVPIGTSEGGVRGVVLVAREAGRPVFSAKETEMLQGFAAQAAIAMELAERRQDAQQIALLEDRDRIARDLHDLAIQRLFATGMTLQSAGRFIEHSEAAERVLRAVDDLDETIKIIRSTIFGLRTREGAAGTGLRARIVRMVGEATPVLGFAPSVRMEGLIDTDVPSEIADHIVAVLSEALTNIARHAHADRAQVVVTTDGREVCLKVSDNGVGIPPDGRRSGLRNMAERAESLGGRLQVSGAGTGGAEVEWRVPLPADHGHQ